MTVIVEVRRGAYHDSVSLMQASRVVAAADGVDAALVAMATELNLELLDGMGFDRPDDVGPNDLLVAVRASDEDAAARAHQVLENALTELGAGHGSGGAAAGDLASGPAPRTVSAAARQAPATLALVSVPGPHAYVEAMDALEAGLSVMVFSDNVLVEQEVALKDEGRRRDLLVMGPDCGTAIVGGVGLGFSNAVRPGPVGVIAASGTGAQQLSCLLDAAGVGVSHVLGVGGRDLSAAVGGRSTMQALDLLDGDPATELIVLVSKPPEKTVADEVRGYAATLRTPVQFALLGRGQPDLTAAAQGAVSALNGSWDEPRWWPAPQQRSGDYRVLRGLFAGGTLCDEAMVIAAEVLGPVMSNIPLEPEWALGDDLRASGHLMIDFGDDRLTQGRPHPMIDQSQRIERLLEEATGSRSPVVLLDVVLGHGAHADPAAELAPALTEAHRLAVESGRELAAVVSLCGAADDPQGLERQAMALAAAGASVHLSNAAGARKALELLADEAKVRDE
jgi:FdrA protein